MKYQVRNYASRWVFVVNTPILGHFALHFSDTKDRSLRWCWAVVL